MYLDKPFSANEVELDSSKSNDEAVSSSFL